MPVKISEANFENFKLLRYMTTFKPFLLKTQKQKNVFK